MPDRADPLQRLKELYEQYLEQAEKVEKETWPLAGAFGTRGAPADDPCHVRFADELKEFLDGYVQSGPDPEEARALLEEIFAAAKRPCPRSAFWMLLAVHNLTEGTIACLRPEDAGALRTAYSAEFPRNRRLPAQENVLRWLEEKE